MPHERESVQTTKMVRNLSCISQLKGKKQTVTFSGTWQKNESYKGRNNNLLLFTVTRLS